MNGLAPKLPLTIDPVDGAYKLLKNHMNMITQNLKNLVLTSPGERVMDPEFGVGIRNFLFEQNEPINHEEISIRINQQVGRYMPFLKINTVVTSPEDNPELDIDSIKVGIYYTIIPLSATGILEISV